MRRVIGRGCRVLMTRGTPPSTAVQQSPGSCRVMRGSWSRAATRKARRRCTASGLFFSATMLLGHRQPDRRRTKLSHQPQTANVRIPRGSWRDVHTLRAEVLAALPAAPRMVQPIDTSTCHPGFRCIVRVKTDGNGATRAWANCRGRLARQPHRLRSLSSSSSWTAGQATTTRAALPWSRKQVRHPVETPTPSGTWQRRLAAEVGRRRLAQVLAPHPSVPA